MALTSRVLFCIKNLNKCVFIATQQKDFLRNGPKISHLSFRLHSSSPGVKTAGVKTRDPAYYFFNEEVQDLLLELNMQDTTKVFEPRREREKLSDPELKFLTQDQLEEVQRQAMETAKYYLQVPPVLLPKEDEVRILSKDPELQGLDESKFLFTDISYGVPHRNRIVVARDPDGTLRYATREEHRRMVHAYFPKGGRTYETPNLFATENVMSLLERSEFVYVLDRACAQFEPDDPEYVEITSLTYNYIDKNKKYDDLFGTRHYGSMAFYLIFHGQLDRLLNYCISTFKIKEAVILVKVFYLTQPDIKAPMEPSHAADTAYLKQYIDNFSKDKSVLSKTLNAFMESGVPVSAKD